MPKPVTIRLDKDYPIQPLTVGQLEDITVAIVAPDTGDPQKDARAGFERMIHAIAGALSIDHPEITADVIRAMRVTRHELTTAHATVLEHSEIASVPVALEEVQKALAGDSGVLEPKAMVTREQLILAYATVFRARQKAPSPGEAVAGTASTGPTSSAG